MQMIISGEVEAVYVLQAMALNVKPLNYVTDDFWDYAVQIIQLLDT
jgi:hypothetical protein